MGKGTFRIRSGSELLHQAQSKLSEHIQVLLDGTIYDTAEVFRKMDMRPPKNVCKREKLQVRKATTQSRMEIRTNSR